MKPWRLFATAVLATIALCSLVLLARHHRSEVNEIQVRNVLARANAGLEGTSDREEFLRTNGAAVLRVGGTLAGMNDYLWVEAEQLKGSKDVQVPVDGYVEKVVFGVTGSLKKPEWSLKDPQGRRIDVRQRPGQQVDLDQGAMLSVSHPEVGTWTLHVTANDNVFIFVRAASNTGFDACEMRPDGRLDIQVSAEELSGARFRIFSKEGLPLGSWIKVPEPSVSLSGTPGRREYRYQLQIPKIPGPFRLEAQIQDLHGHVAQRVCDPLIQTASS